MTSCTAIITCTYLEYCQVIGIANRSNSKTSLNVAKPIIFAMIIIFREDKIREYFCEHQKETITFNDHYHFHWDPISILIDIMEQYSTNNVSELDYTHTHTKKNLTCYLKQ